MPINKNKGDVEIVLGGKTMFMRPTFEAMAEFEAVSGATAIELVDAIKQAGLIEGTPKGLTFKVVTSAITAGIRAAMDPRERPPTMREIGDIVMEQGIMDLAPVVIDWLLIGVLGRRNMEKAAQGNAGRPAEESKTPA